MTSNTGQLACQTSARAKFARPPAQRFDTVSTSILYFPAAQRRRFPRELDDNPAPTMEKRALKQAKSVETAAIRRFAESAASRTGIGQLLRPLERTHG